MTEKELMQYNILKRLIEKREEDIEKEKMKEKEIPIVAGKVKASMKGFPYIETRVGVQMKEPKKVDAVIRKIKIYAKEIVDAEEKIAKIEEFISTISDPELKLIFEMRCYRNMSWINIATEIIAIDRINSMGELTSEKNRTTYYRKFKKFLEKCT